MTNENEVKPKKKDPKWLWIIGGIFLLVMIIAITGGEGEKKETEPEVATPIQEEITQSSQEGVQKQPETQEEPKVEILTEPKPQIQPEPETKTDRDKMIEIFKAEALAKWGNDYAMVKWEVNKQTEAYDWVIKQTKYLDIVERAKQKWGNDYAMVRWEYEKQAGAYEWINQQTAYPEIMARAKQKWGDDYAMVKWEYEKQVEAYEAL